MDLLRKKIFKRDLSPALQLRFLKRLLRLLQAGYAMIEALEMIMWDRPLKTMAITIKQALLEGQGLDQAFIQAGFHESIVNHVYVLHLNGDVEQVLSQSIEMFEQRLKYVHKFKQVIRYPLILSVIFVLLVYGLQTFIYPAFNNIFHMELASITLVQTSLLLLTILFRFILISIGLAICCLIGWHLIKERFPIHKKVNWYQNIPIFRRYLKFHTTFQLASQISSSLKAGLSFKEILRYLSTQVQFPIVAYYADLMMQALQQGLHLEQLLRELPLIDSQLAIIFQKYHNVQMLQQDLTIYADWLIENMQEKTMNLIEMIQPVFFSFLALLIILMYVMLMWPMFDMMRMI